MTRRRKNTTKKEIIQVATRMFLNNGFTNTSAKSISDELGISNGNLTFHFQTKEHLLAVLVEMLCDFQRKMIERAVDEGDSSLLAFCLELPAMAAICEENEHAKDFYFAAYTHPITLDIIQRNDKEKAKQIMRPYCPDWTDEHFTEAEILVSGIEYATLSATSHSVPLAAQIVGALSSILMIYQVPAEICNAMVRQVLAMDYRALGSRIFEEFMQYIEEVNEHALEDA